MDKTSPFPRNKANLDNLLAPFVQLSSDEFPFLVPVPTAGDSVAATARKLSDLATIIRGGRSLVYTDPMTAQPAKAKHDAEAYAKERMLPAELAMYEDWKTCVIRLPALDWAKNVLPVDRHAQVIFSQRAAAMDLIWHHQGATPENAAYFMVFHLDLLPLVKAVAKLLSAKAYLENHDSLCRLSVAEVAEMKALQLVNGIVVENLALESEPRRDLVESIRESQTVLKEQLYLLETK